jgi:hypothetical protein
MGIQEFEDLPDQDLQIGVLLALLQIRQGAGAEAPGLFIRGLAPGSAQWRQCIPPRRRSASGSSGASRAPAPNTGATSSTIRRG